MKAVQELLEGTVDSDLDSDKCANIEHFVGIKDDSNDTFKNHSPVSKTGRVSLRSPSAVYDISTVLSSTTPGTRSLFLHQYS